MFKILQTAKRLGFQGFRFYSGFIFPSLSKMNNKAVVKRFEGEERFTFSFHLKIEEMKIDKQFNLNRDLCEGTAVFLERLQNNINKAHKRKKKKSESSEDDLDVAFMQETTAISPVEYETIKDFLFLKNLQMKIKEITYNVTINPPLVREFKISEVVMTELFIYPHILRLDFSDDSKTRIEWFISNKVDDESLKHLSKKAKQDFEENLTWTKEGEGFYFTPPTYSINSLLKCVVTPFRESVEGEVFSFIVQTPITSGPGITPSFSRHVWTSSTLPNNQLRVISYNLLADLYADSDFSRTVLFAQCPPYALAIEYRIKLILSELIGFQAT